MPKGNGFKPGDPHIDLVRVVSTGNLEIFPVRRSRSHKYSVVVFLKESSQALDRCVQAQINTHINDHVDLFVEYLCRQPKSRYVGPHKPARNTQLLEHGDFVSQGHQIVGHCEGCGSCPDQGNPFAVLFAGDGRKPVLYLAPEVCRNALETADRHWLLLDSPSTAGWLTGPVTDATQNTRKNVGFSVEQVGFGVLPLGDQPYILRYIGMGGAGPLTVHDAVIIVRITCIGRVHKF